MKDYTLEFIGAGRVTNIMLEGFKRAGKSPHKVVVTDLNQETLDAIERRFPGIDVVLNDNKQAGVQNIVLLALHPLAISAVLDQIRPSIRKKTIIVSLALKIISRQNLRMFRT